MSVTQHLDAATLMAYGSGTLSESYTLVTAAHLAVCDRCRAEARRLESVGGALMMAAEPAPLRANAHERLLDAIDADTQPARPVRTAAADPAQFGPLARYLDGGLSGVKWKARGPGVWTSELPTERPAGGRLFLLRVRAGQAVPEHGHRGHELTMIVQGAYRDRFGYFGPGDVADHDEDVEHQPIAEPGADCICLVALDTPLRFKDRLIRLIQPFIGI